MNQVFIDQWRETAEAFDQRFQAIGDHGRVATPCADWCVDELVDHAVEVQKRVAGGMLGLDLADDAEWPVIRQSIDGALADPSVLDGQLPDGPFGPMPKSMMFGIAISDLLVHTWDLARAIGADESLPAAPVESAYMGLQRMPAEAIRVPGRFDEAVEVADDADMQTKLIAFSGRQI